MCPNCHSRNHTVCTVLPSGMNPFNQPELKQNDSPNVNQTRSSVDIATVDVHKRPDAQAELLAFASDPKTIAKAAEWSMDKRLAVLDAQAEVGLREKIMQLLPHGPCQCNLGKECVSDTNYYADQLTALFQADKAAAVDVAIEDTLKHTYTASQVREAIHRALSTKTNYRMVTAIIEDVGEELARLQPPTAGEGESV